MRDMRLMPGDPAPWFHVRSSGGCSFNIDAAAGHWLALTFIDSSQAAGQGSTIDAIEARGGIFDGRSASWLIVTADPLDELPGRLPLRAPGIRAVFDKDHEIRILYCIPSWGLLPITLILSPQLAVAGTIAAGAPAQHAEALSRVIEARRDIGAHLAEARRVPGLSPPRMSVPARTHLMPLCTDRSGLALSARSWEDERAVMAGLDLERVSGDRLMKQHGEGESIERARSSNDAQIA